MPSQPSTSHKHSMPAIVMAVILAVAGFVSASAQSIAPLDYPGVTWMKVPLTGTDSVWVKVQVLKVKALADSWLAAYDSLHAKGVNPLRPIEVDEEDVYELRADARRPQPQTMTQSFQSAQSSQASQSSGDTLSIESATMPLVAPGMLQRNWDAPARQKPQGLKFTWGADFGTGIDMTGHDMSTIDISANFGMAWQWMNFLGVGAGVNMPVSNSMRTYPVYLLFRTDFSRRLQPVFIDLRGGLALHYLEANQRQSGAYGSAAVGFNLACGQKFRSFITAGVTYMPRHDMYKAVLPLDTSIVGDSGADATDYIRYDYPSLILATLRLGVSF